MQNQARTAADGSLVALVDCDTFYASCERVCRPDLEGKPIVVLSNNDGCIVARSREAKKLGIQIGEPEFQFRPSGHDEMTIITLPCPTSDSMTIAGAAEKGLQKILRPGYGYAKAMVMLTDLSNPAKGQHNMLDLIGNEKEMRERRNALMGLMDRLHRLEGRGTLVIASQGPKNASWHMKRDRLSPSWTTNLKEILKVGD